jgi:hypothetical protein
VLDSCHEPCFNDEMFRNQTKHHSAWRPDVTLSFEGSSSIRVILDGSEGHHSRAK